jgi:hypothetical protein
MSHQTREIKFKKKSLSFKFAIFVRGHVSRQVMSFTEIFSTDGTSQFLLSLLADGIGIGVATVLRPHVVDEIGRHAETEIALGANVLRWRRCQTGR